MKALIKLIKLFFKLSYRSLVYIRYNGLKRFFSKILQLFEQLQSSYSFLSGIHLENQRNPLNVKGKEYQYTLGNMDLQDINRQLKGFTKKPLISIIIPVYNISREILSQTIQSVLDQYYPHWEICIAEDASPNREAAEYLKSLNHEKIKIEYLRKNQGISGASNSAANLATGEYLALLDHDDTLALDALFEVVKILNQNEYDLIYSDEDLISEKGNQYIMPHFKPDFSLDLLLSINYICHFVVVKKSLFDKIGGFRRGYEGAQDHDLLLRVIEQTNKIAHIPKVLYHWRMIASSVTSDFSVKPYAWTNGKKAVADYLKRNSIKGDVFFGYTPGTYRVKRQLLSRPLISIIIPFKDKPELLMQVLNSILSQSTYNHYEIIGINNNSTESQTFNIMEHFQTHYSNLCFYDFTEPFNYSRINNYAASLAKGEHLILLNNDIEIISADWMETLLEHSQRPEIGAVGAKLYFPNETIEHAGLIVGLKVEDMMYGAIHPFKHSFRKSGGYFSRLFSIQNQSAVMASCLMVKKALYEQVGGFNEIELKIAYNDIDFCLRLRELGYLNLFTPYCEAYHYESASRGYPDNSEKMKREKQEFNYLVERHKNFFDKGDPYGNPNFSKYPNFLGVFQDQQRSH